MNRFKKIAAVTSVAAAVTFGLVIPVVAQPAPTSNDARLTTCRTWTETVKKPGCDYKKQICEAYIYHRICD